MRVKPPVVLSRLDFSVPTVDEVIFQLRAEAEDFPVGGIERAGLQVLINSAAAWVEGYTSHYMVGADVELALDAFPSADLELPVYPLRELVEVAYTDADGQSQVLPLGDVDVDLMALRPRLRGVIGWPETKASFNTVRIKCRVGYEQADKVPDGLRLATLMLAVHLFENSSATAAIKLEEVPFGVRSMANQQKVNWL